MIAEPVVQPPTPTPDRRRRPRLLALTGILGTVVVVLAIIVVVFAGHDARLSRWICEPMESFTAKVTTYLDRRYVRQGCLVADLRAVPLVPSDPDPEREIRGLFDRAMDAWYDRLTEEPRELPRPVLDAVDVTVLEPNVDVSDGKPMELRMNSLSSLAMNEAVGFGFGSSRFPYDTVLVGPSPKDPSVWIYRADNERNGNQLFCGIEIPAAGAVVETLRARCVIFGPSQLEM